MQLETIQSKLTNLLGSKILNSTVEYDTVIIEIAPSEVIPVLTALKEDKELDMNMLVTLCGLHHPQHKDKELGVMYQLRNLFTSDQVRIKTYVPLDKPNVPTVTELYPTANWMERQEYDFFGIIFEGHPNLTRILNMDEMTEYPMRKEYRLEDPTRDDKQDKFFGRIQY